METRFNLIHFILCFFMIIVLVACGDNSKNTGYSEQEAEAPMTTDAAPPAPAEYAEEEDFTGEKTTTPTANEPQQAKKSTETQPEESIAPMLIKTGQLNISVNNATKFRGTVDAKLKKYGAYIVNEQQNQTDYEISNQLTIRVPAAKFDSLLTAFESEKGKVSYKNISVQDVTAEYLDQAGRLKTRKEVRDRYQALLGKANKVNEIIEIEEAARKVQEEIEAAEGQLKYLRNQSSFSTLTLYIAQDLKYRGDGFGQRLLDGLANGWQGFLMFLVGIAHLWVFLIIGAFAFYFIRKRFFKKK
jgi:hypothetical protein